MPLKVVGSNLWHEQGGKWTIKQSCSSHDNAVKAMRAIKATILKGAK